MKRVSENRQARVVLGDRIKYSLQLTALRLNPRRLRGVQALTMHYPWLTTNDTETFALYSMLLAPCDTCSTKDNLNGVDECKKIGIFVHPSIRTDTVCEEPLRTVVLARLRP